MALAEYVETAAGAGAPAEALRRAVEALRARQDPAGWWKAELQTNVTMDAEDLMLRQFLGVRTAGQTTDAARWIRSQQRPDGTWATFEGGPADLSTTIEAYVALRLAGDDPQAAHLARAAAYVREHGGVARSRIFTRIWLALFGLWSYDDLPVLPPEVIFLPPSVPLNVYDFACWARQTIVPLCVVSALRPVRPLGVELPELSTAQPPRPRSPLRTWAGRFEALDRGLHRYERRPLSPLRRHALRRCAEWIVARQEADGSWGGIQPPWVYSLIALHLLGYPLDHPVLAAGLAGLDAFTITDERGRRLEACQSPVWDTALSVLALADAGVPADDPAVTAAGVWLLGEEVTARGDWAVRRPALAPGGWAFEFANENYPDIDDTAEVLFALRRTAVDVGAAGDRAVAWTLGMQCRDGGWGAFDADNDQRLCVELPFCDFGAVIDPPSADVTAHAVEMLAHEGMAGHPAVRRAVDWLLAEQEPGGSWFGRWGVNHLYGTGAVVPALVAAGIEPRHAAIRAAVRWLEGVQNDDGGFGEDIRSYTDPAWIGRGASTASQTAWALLALLAADERSATVARAVGWLVATQRADGSWDERQFTGTGFPGDFSINYHHYRLAFPVMALGRYVREAS